MSLFKLQQAYHLIKNRDFAAARPLVLEVLREDKNNLDAWWLAVYVAESDRDKHAALNKVLALNPDHAAAQEIRRRLHSPVDQFGITQPRLKKTSLTPPKKKSRLPYILGLFGLIMAGFTVLAIFDAITGKNVLRPVQQQVIGEGENFGYVEANNVGIATGNEVGLPIVSETKAEMSQIQNQTLFNGEAHAYKIVGQPNDTLYIFIVFSQDLVGFDEADLLDALNQVSNIDPNNRPKPTIPLIELWNGENKVVAQGTIGDLPGTQMIEYTPTTRESLKLIVAGRDGNPTGNYFVQITSSSGIMLMAEQYNTNSSR